MKEEQPRNYSIKDLQIEELVPTNIEGVSINVVNKIREIGLPLLMGGEQFTKWKNRKAGPFYRDLFLWAKGRDHGKYVSMEEGDEKLIVRLIDENEYDDFAARKLVHGKIKDKPYMILQNLSKNQDSEEKDGYIKEILEEYITLDNSMNINQPNIPQEDDEAGSGKSISLFDD
jgi:hypothetical protein